MPNIWTRALKSACLCAAPSGVCHPHPSVARGTDTVLLYLLHRPALLLQVIEVHRSFSGVELFTAQSTIEPIKLLGTAIVLYQDSVACVTFQFPRVVRSVSSGSLVSRAVRLQEPPGGCRWLVGHSGGVARDLFNYIVAVVTHFTCRYQAR